MCSALSELIFIERVQTNKQINKQMHGLIAVRCEEKQTGGRSVLNNKR